jgi:perosamine synthetase
MFLRTVRRFSNNEQCGDNGMVKHMANKVDALRIRFTEQGERFILRKIRETLKSGLLTNNANTREFEDKFAKFTGAKHSIAVNTGSTAIEATLKAVGIERNRGQIVFSPTLTAPPTVYSSIYAGARVVLVDSKKEDFGMDPKDLLNKIEEYKKEELGAIITVHVGGIISPHITEIIDIGRKYGIPVIEDCAHAHGATYAGVGAGVRGIAGTYSFFLTKVLTSGEGGAVITNDPTLDTKIRILRNYGKDANGLHSYPGSNWRLNEFSAAVALWQTIDARNVLAARRNIAKLYDTLLTGIAQATPLRIPHMVESSYYKYIVLLNRQIDRTALKKELKEKYHIELTGEVYANPCHTEPIFLDNPAVLNSNGDFPQAEEIARQHICLPIYPGLTEEQAVYVVDSLKDIFMKECSLC